MSEENLYIQVLIDALEKKKNALEHINELTQRQSLLLTEDKLDMDEFDHLIEDKSVYIEELNQLDEGFEQTFQRVRAVLNEQRAAYRTEIAAMQKSIREIMSLSMEIEAKEARNKHAFEQAAGRHRQSIKTKRLGKTSAARYYQTAMKAEQNQSFYMDKKK